MINKIIINSQIDWLNLVVFWCIHWNEICWKKAILSVVEMFNSWWLKLKSWKITFVPVSNIEANIQNKRYVDIDLNRVFKKHEVPTIYEHKLANELTTIIDENDVLLDLHSSHTDDEPFVFLDYTDEKNNFLAKSCWLKNIIVWWPELYSEDKSSDTCGYINSKWKIWVTVECWNHEKQSSVDIAKDCILNVLKSYDMIDWNLKIQYNYNKILLKEYIIKSKKWEFVKVFNHLDKVKKWEKIVIYENKKELLAPYDWFIIMPNPYVEIWGEWFYLWVWID